MQIIEEIAKSLSMNRERFERESLKTFLEKELGNVEVEIYKSGNLFLIVYKI